jgi:hypothetical protein
VLDRQSGVHVYLQNLTVRRFYVYQHVVSNKVVHDEVVVLLDTEMVEGLRGMHGLRSNLLNGQLLTRSQF